MDSDIWATLVEQAKARAACASSEAVCHVQAVVGPLYTMLTHVSVHDHDCKVCPPRELLRHLVSIEALQTTKRDELVARVARFLNHCHASDPESATELRAA